MNFKSPIVIIAILLGITILAIIFLTAAGAIISVIQILIIIIVFVVMLVIAYFATHAKNTVKEPMGAAKKFIIDWWQEQFSESIANKKIIGTHRSYAIDDEEYGFLFYRSSGGRTSVPGAIVVKKVGGGFVVRHYNEEATKEAANDNPFILYETKFVGSPNQDMDFNRQAGNIQSPGSRTGVNVNVGDRPVKDSFKAEADKGK